MSFSTNPVQGKTWVGRLQRALLQLMLAGVAGVSFSGCIWVHDHDQDHDHDRDHWDHHDEHPEDHP